VIPGKFLLAILTAQTVQLVLYGRAALRSAGGGRGVAAVNLLLAWTLGLCLLWERDYASPEGSERRKYGGRPLPRRDAEALLRRARSFLEAAEDLSSDEVEPRGIAAGLGVPYYIFSRAVNETLGTSVSDLLNEYRIERAKKLLAGRPDLGILEIGLASGFQAKSTFNEVFRRRVGRSPRQFREALRAGDHEGPEGGR
jgi:AraC-like DNA-binding protein